MRLETRIPQRRQIAARALRALLAAHLLALAGASSVGAEEKRPVANTDASPDAETDPKLTRAARGLRDAEDVRAALAAARVLADAFPASRPQLHRAVTRGPAITRCIALKTLGEEGEASHDLPVVLEGLKDAHQRVRAAAVLAVRHLGSDGLPALVRYLSAEPVPNNRKAAVKTLRLWRDPRSVDAVIGLLETEPNSGVRFFCVEALGELTGRHYGDDIEAWRDYQRAMRLRENAQREEDGETPGDDE